MDVKATVLVADDEAGLVRLLKSELELAGYQVIAAEDGTRAVELAAKWNPDVIILDLVMPGKDGFAVCEEVRGFSYLPIIMLSARDQEGDKIRALNIGADDYLTKPFGMGELLARVSAAVRRTRFTQGDVRRAPLEIGGIAIDFAAHQVRKNGELVSLTTTEYKLLCALIQHPGTVVIHETLLATVWGREYVEQTEYLWVYIGRLRNRLEDDPSHPRMIVTVPGAGYRFDPAGAASA